MSKTETNSWRDVLPIHPAANLFPLMTPDELKALGQDIKKNEVRVPIILWSESENTKPLLLDGRNRLDAAELAGIKVFEVREDKGYRIEFRVPYRRLYGSGGGRSMIDGSSLTADPYEFVLSANVHRRHLTTAQRIELVEKVLKANPHMSGRRVAKLAGVSPTTAAKARDRLEQRGDVSTVDTSIDTKGRNQPTKKKRRDIDDFLAEKRAREAERQPKQVDLEDLAPTGQRQAEPAARQERIVTLADWKEMSPSARAAALKPDPAGRDSRFNKQEGDSIEWAQWSWNPVTGCLHDCPYCYARDIAERFYTQKFEPAFHPYRLDASCKTKVPDQAATDTRYKNVFTCSMADLFGRWVPREWIDAVLDRVRANQQWNFLFLTKFPKRMAEFNIPSNAWMGTTVDLQARVANAEAAFEKLNPEAGLRWLSVEPMLEPLKFKRLDLFHWIVIGGASASTKSPEFRPPFRWIADLVEQAERAGTRVYMKSNLLGNRLLQMPFDAPIVGDETEAPPVFHYLNKPASSPNTNDLGVPDFLRREKQPESVE